MTACIRPRYATPPGTKRGGGRPTEQRGAPCRYCGEPVPASSRFSAYCSNSCACRYGKWRRAKQACDRDEPGDEQRRPATRIATDDPEWVRLRDWTGPELEQRRATLERLAKEIDRAERKGTINAEPAAWLRMARSA